MLIESPSSPYVFTPIYGPDGWSTASVTCEVALVDEATTTVPAASWSAAAWEGTSVRFLVDTASYPDGQYVLKVRLTSGSEVVVLTAGRVRIGDART